MNKLRVLVVEDSLTMRKRLCEVMGGDPDFEIVGEAADGRQAIELCSMLRPDVISLDMMLPVIDGLTAAEYIMAHFATPILVVSSSTNRGELFKTYQALAAGVVEVLEKPGIDDLDGEWERRFLSTLKLVARVKVITHVRALRSERQDLTDASDKVCRAAQTCDLIAIGASTGGPRAVAEVLRALPRDLTQPILVIVHIAASFGEALAEWLDGQLMHKVRFASDGQPLVGPGVFLAPPGRHLRVGTRKLHLSDDPERNSWRPSIDVLFESIATHCGRTAAACLLTGMGSDGARGLLAIRQAGGLTIAQDEASSVVYGMPREAVQLNAAQIVLPLAEIGKVLTAQARKDAAKCRERTE